MQIKWIGHSAMQITSNKGTVIYVDPWFDFTEDYSLESVEKADYVCLTHDHFDHRGCAGDIVKKYNAVLVAQPEICTALKKDYDLDDSLLINGMGMNTGGTVQLNDIKVTMVEAVHSSEHGTPAGFVFQADGKVFYHTGDTALFATMSLIGEFFKPDIVALPIGGIFTMDPVQAAKAVALIGAPKVIPIHYKTFPILTQDVQEFTNLVKDTEVLAVQAGKTVDV